MKVLLLVTGVWPRFADGAELQGGVIPTYRAEIVQAWPHDPGAFTQGLLFHEGYLFESTGLHGQSSVRRVDLETGRVLERVDLGTEYFAEGITLHEGKIYQLTWHSGKGFVYSLEGLRPIDEFSYEGEGWGLTDDGRYLIMSDGTHQLRFLDPTDFTVRRTLDIYSNDEPVTYLNELEYVKGEIYANIWYSDRIARIDPHTGQVVGWIELDGLLSPPYRRRPEGVLNGMAYDEAHDRLFVTGKLWPKIFEIRVKRSER